MSKEKTQPLATENPSKKELSKVVFTKLTGSLTEFNLTDKKLESRLEKVSRRLASDIVKLLKKEAPKAPKTTRRKKAAKQIEAAVAE